MPDEKRNQLLDDILRKNDWIIEGVFYDWLDGSFRDADVIILLDIPKRVYRFRIIRRFVKKAWNGAGEERNAFFARGPAEVDR